MCRSQRHSIFEMNRRCAKRDTQRVDAPTRVLPSVGGNVGGLEHGRCVALGDGATTGVGVQQGLAKLFLAPRSAATHSEKPVYCDARHPSQR